MSAIVLSYGASTNATTSTLAAAAAASENNWWALIVLVLVFATATGNILVCLAITWETRLQNVTNYFLMSLAITDLMVAVLVMPLGILTLFKGYFPFDSFHCLVWICFDVLFCTASIMHLCTISVDRYLSLRYPMKFGRNKTRKRVILKIIFVWLLSIAMSLPLCLMYSGNHESILIDGLCQIPDPLYKLIGSIVCFYVPLLVMLVTYMLTVRLLARQQKNLEGLKKSKKNHFRFASHRLRRHNKGSVMSTPESMMMHALTNANGPAPKNTIGTSSIRHKSKQKFWSLSKFERRKRLNNQISITTETDMTVNLEVPLPVAAAAAAAATTAAAAAPTLTTTIPTTTSTATPTTNSVNSSGCSVRRPLLGHATIAAINTSSCSSFEQPTSTADEALTASNADSEDEGEEDDDDDDNDLTRAKSHGVKRFDHDGTQLWLDDYRDDDDDDDDEDDDNENNSTVVMTALQQFGAQMLTLSRGLQSLNSCESIKTCLDKIIGEQPLDSNTSPAKTLLPPPPPPPPLPPQPPQIPIGVAASDRNEPKPPEEIELKPFAATTPKKSQLIVQINNEQQQQQRQPFLTTALKRPRSQKLRTNTTSTGTDPVKTSTRHGRIILLEQKATKVLGMVFFAFVILWSPFFVLNLLPILCDRCEQQIHHTVFDLATWLGYASSMINPILYTIFNQTFRKTFWNLLTGQYCRRRPSKFSMYQQQQQRQHQCRNRFLATRSRTDFQKII